MRQLRRIVLAGCLPALCAGALAGPVANGWASDASIKAALRSYEGRILTTEGKVVTAIGEYKSSGNPKPVQTALGEAVAVLRALRSKVQAQSAKSSRVKAGKAALVKGLRDVISSYGHLSSAFGVKSVSTSAAKAQAAKALAALRVGKAELRKAGRLLR